MELSVFFKTLIDYYYFQIIIASFYVDKLMETFNLKLLSDISIVVTLFILILQVRHATSSYKRNIDIQRKDQAIRLSQFYAESIIPASGYTKSIFEKYGVEEILAGKEYFLMKEFNMEEMTRLLSEKDINHFCSISNKFDYIHLLNISLKYKDISLEVKQEYWFLLSQNFDIILSDKEYMNSLSKEEVEKFLKTCMKIDILKYELLNEYNQVNTELLNNLEYFAMSFVQELADETVVYQSLHQTYLSVIQMLYIHISLLNKSEHLKYYKNIICLYCKWAEKKRNKILEETNYCSSENIQ